jgi:hypothetical protein
MAGRGQVRARWTSLLFPLLAAAGCDLPPDARSGPGLDRDAAADGPGAASDGAAGFEAQGDASARGDGSAPADDYAFVVLPDTQYYASSWPDIFQAQTRWLVDNRDAQRIRFVLHSGDLVDSDVPAQWQVASSSLAALDGQIPYVVSAGNHDYSNLADRMGMGNQYFPPSRFAPFPWFGGTFEPDHIENSFSLITAGAESWLVISLEFGPRDEALTWAGGVLSALGDHPAIVITHAYLYRDGNRYDHAGAPSQQFNPHGYVMVGQPGTSINDGEEIWQKLILPHPNVKLVFSGHDVSGGDLPPGTAARLTSTRPDGSHVHQILANYQTCLGPPCARSAQGTMVRGGHGFLRILRVSPRTRTIAVSTYSPYLDRTLSDASNEFTIDY